MFDATSTEPTSKLTTIDPVSSRLKPPAPAVTSSSSSTAAADREAGLQPGVISTSAAASAEPSAADLSTTGDFVVHSDPSNSIEI
jgi:hypothetical protein